MNTVHPNPPPLSYGADVERVRLAIQAANTLFDDPTATPPLEPDTPELAREAVGQLERRFADLPGVVTSMLEGSRAGAEVLSGDRLQGIAEIVQNADDAGATSVHFVVEPDALTAKHNGRPVVLRDVLALATPWLTTKRDDSRATGRFGIGLMTLRSLSSVLEVFTDLYSIRLGAPTIEWALRPELPFRGETGGETVFRIPFEGEPITEEEMEAWLSRWDDAAILFCTNVTEVTFAFAERQIRKLSLEWHDLPGSGATVAGQDLAVSRKHVIASDGRQWVVSTAEPKPPAGARRARKALGETTPIGVALPLGFIEDGCLYTGLPLRGSRFNVRANAQFDPIASRQDLASNKWNQTLYPMVADLWAASVTDLFKSDPRVGWCLIPIWNQEPTATSKTGSSFNSAVYERSISVLPDTLTIQIEQHDLHINELAVEEKVLEGVLLERETARLAGLEFALPAAARDSTGRWREVLAHWREVGVSLAPEVTTSSAVELFFEPDRDLHSNVSLAAAAIRAGLEDELIELPCVATERGERICPPVSPEPSVLVTEASDLGSDLGVSRRLHRAYLIDSADAKVVRNWLKSQGALIDGTDPYALLDRLATAGDAGHKLPHALSDDQILALRDVFERLGPDERTTVGARIGRAIKVECYEFDERGQKRIVEAPPSDAYLPKRIERERLSFATAAGKAPGLIWINGRYADLLRSEKGRAGLGAQKFLRLLGAETAPRLLPHPEMRRRFSSDHRPGLHRACTDSPPARTRALVEHGATYTLNDKHSPDLTAVVTAISNDRRARRRRERAAALLAALGRAWDRLSDFVEVTAADDNYFWREKGSIRAFWLWEASSIPWLDDPTGTPRPPHELRLRTPATVAVHGTAASEYVHKDLGGDRQEVLVALGVLGEPSTSDLVARLKAIQVNPEDEDPAPDAAVVYQALAQRIEGRRRMPGDLPAQALARAFEESPLIYSNLGWRRASQVLVGKPIFGDYRAFVPAVVNAHRLWSMLRIRDAGPDDCIEVLNEISRGRSEPSISDQAVMLESLRMLCDRVGQGFNKNQMRRLARLPLWTTMGWTRDRPIYAIEDPAVSTGVGSRVPVWTPGGEVAQFRNLFALLKLTEFSTDQATVIKPEFAEPDDDATDFFRSAVAALREDLARNDADAASALRITWDGLLSLKVRIHPDLAVEVPGVIGLDQPVVPVAAKIDYAAGIVYLRDASQLSRLEGGGRAVASLFATDRRQLAQAWLAACEAAESGRQAARIQLADERMKEDGARLDAEMTARLEQLRRATSSAHLKTSGAEQGGRSSSRIVGSASALSRSPTSVPPGVGQPKPRILVDPATLRLVDTHGRLEGAAHSSSGNSTSPKIKGSRGRRGRPNLPDPNLAGNPPSESTPPPQYTSISKETVGLELVRMVLGSDADEMRDLRAQRGVGADAVDALGRYFELKVYAGPEPDRITLQESQIRKALSTPEYFLVVVSEVEGPAARPKVRVITNPIDQLRMAESSSISFTGVRSSQSLVYEFVPHER